MQLPGPAPNRTAASDKRKQSVKSVHSFSGAFMASCETVGTLKRTVLSRGIQHLEGLQRGWGRRMPHAAVRSAARLLQILHLLLPASFSLLVARARLNLGSCLFRMLFPGGWGNGIQAVGLQLLEIDLGRIQLLRQSQRGYLEEGFPEAFALELRSAQGGPSEFPAGQPWP